MRHAESPSEAVLLAKSDRDADGPDEREFQNAVTRAIREKGRPLTHAEVLQVAQKLGYRKR